MRRRLRRRRRRRRCRRWRRRRRCRRRRSRRRPWRRRVHVGLHEGRRGQSGRCGEGLQAARPTPRPARQAQLRTPRAWRAGPLRVHGAATACHLVEVLAVVSVDPGAMRCVPVLDVRVRAIRAAPEAVHLPALACGLGGLVAVVLPQPGAHVAAVEDALLRVRARRARACWVQRAAPASELVVIDAIVIGQPLARGPACPFDRHLAS
mmetsp:Transcript_80963/g.234697  ORF Transcript_80963/g.234697 Transcript_80963/m.234697 type:complete len:207 (-) Transcript_80963:293-913(-)